jgi:hypothetical protein
VDQAQFPSGTLDLLILEAVSLTPLHGYGRHFVWFAKEC